MPGCSAGLLRRLSAQMVYTSVQTRVFDFIKNPEPARFEALGLAVFTDQFEKIEPYRRFCLDCGVSPEAVRSVREIPPVSTAAFKYVALGCEAPQRIFLTSGTTRGREQRGRHLIAD